MHRLVQPQPFDIGERDDAVVHAGHDIRLHRGFHGNELCPGLHADLGQHVRKLHAIPRHHHRPGLDTAEPIDALFDGQPVQQIGQSIIAGLVDHPVHLDRPGRGHHRACIRSRIFLAGAEFIVVIVAADFFDGIGHQLFLGPRHSSDRGNAQPGSAANQLAAVHENPPGGHVSPGQGIGPAIGHLATPYIYIEHQSLRTSIQRRL